METIIVKEYSIYLISIEYDVKFANIFKRLIQQVDENLDQVENPQLTFRKIHTEYDINSWILAVNDAIWIKIAKKYCIVVKAYPGVSRKLQEPFDRLHNME